MPRGIPGSKPTAAPFQTQYTVLTGTQRSSIVTALSSALSILNGQVASSPSAVTSTKVVRRRRRRNTTQIQQGEQAQ